MQAQKNDQKFGSSLNDFGFKKILTQRKVRRT